MQKIAKDMNINIVTVHKLLKRYHNGESLERKRESGIKKITNKN